MHCLLPSAGLAKAPGRTAWLEKDEQILWSALMNASRILFSEISSRETLVNTGHQTAGGGEE